MHNRIFVSGPLDFGSQTGAYTMDVNLADPPVNQYSQTPWNILAYDHNGNLIRSDATAASGTTSSMLSGGDPTLFQGVRESAALDTTGDPLDMNNDGTVTIADATMLLDFATGGSGTSPTGADGTTQALSNCLCPPLCEDDPPPPPPPTCTAGPSYVRVADIKYDYRNQMVEYVSWDDRCPGTLGETTTYVYDALGRRLMKTLMATTTAAPLRYITGGDGGCITLQRLAMLRQAGLDVA